MKYRKNIRKNARNGDSKQEEMKCQHITKMGTETNKQNNFAYANVNKT